MKRKQPFTFEQFKTIYSQVPRLCVDLVIHTDQGFLLILRKEHGWEGQWHLPGGTVYYKDKLEDTVHRIAEEELGAKVKIVSSGGYIEYLDDGGFGYPVSIVFRCELVSEITNTDEEIKFFVDLPEHIIKEQKDFLLDNV